MDINVREVKVEDLEKFDREAQKAGLGRSELIRRFIQKVARGEIKVKPPEFTTVAHSD